VKILIRLTVDLLVYLYRILKLTPALLLILFVIPRSTILYSNQYQAIALQVSDHYFDYIGWELRAVGAKANQTLFGMHPFMTEEERSQFVRDYMADLAEAQRLEAQINQIYVDPAIDDPDAETADLREQRDILREDLRSRQTTAEAIIEGQVAAILIEQGFGTGGQLLPPISMRFSQVPNALIISPRDEIKQDIAINMLPLPVDEQAAIESEIDERHDVSSLIVPLGGIALYPAMVFESTSIQWSVETFAHEWLHHYLFFYPLGLNYFTGGAGETRIINETTADFFGKEMSRLVLERYYPDLTPPPRVPSTDDEDTLPPPIIEPDPDAFNFGFEMNETRVTVDELLAAGEVEEAERYMEERRALFVENGFNIRKLNQAFFAFYGGYQAGGVPGIAGEDPIGPAVETVLNNTANLYDFVIEMQGITTRDELMILRDRIAQ